MVEKCYGVDNEVENEVPLSTGLTFHTTGLIVSGTFALAATAISCWLMVQHARHYLRPWEQKHIIRILFMIPVYGLVSFLSVLYYKHAIYFQVLRDCYEAFAIASFFSLLCNYIAPNLHEQKEYFRGLKPVKNWILPINWFQKCSGGMDKGPFRRPSSGLTLFNLLWLMVFQYCVVRPFFTVVSVLAQLTGRYCIDSNSPKYAHVWVSIFEALSVSVAMYGLIQLYHQLSEEISEHRPLIKIICIKLVIFLSFWQEILISLLTNDTGAVHGSDQLTIGDIKFGIPAMLLCVEMTIFAMLHLWAFPWRRPYGIPKDGITSVDAINAAGAGYSGTPKYHGGPFGIKAYLEAFNPWDIIKAVGRGFRWGFVGFRHRREDSSYHGPLDISRPTPLEDMPSPGLGHDGSGAFDKDARSATYANTAYNGAYAGPDYGQPPRSTHLQPVALKTPYQNPSSPAEDDDPWNPHLRTPSRSPSPQPPMPMDTGYHGRGPQFDDRRGLLHDASHPDGFDEDEPQHPPHNKHVRKMSSMARDKQDESSPADVHPAYRVTPGGIEMEDERARGPGRGGWV